MDLLVDTADSEFLGDLVDGDFDHVADLGVQKLSLWIVEYDFPGSLRTMTFDHIVVFHNVGIGVYFEFQTYGMVEVGDPCACESVVELHMIQIGFIFVFLVDGFAVFAFDPEVAGFKTDHTDERVRFLAEVLVEHEAQACCCGEAGDDEQDEEALFLFTENAFAGQIDGKRQRALFDRKMILLEVVAGDTAADGFKKLGLLKGTGRKKCSEEYESREDDHGEDDGRHTDAGESVKTHEAALDIAEKTAQENAGDQGECGSENAKERLFQDTGHAEAAGFIAVCLQDADVLHIHLQEVLDGEVHDDQDQADQQYSKHQDDGGTQSCDQAGTGTAERQCDIERGNIIAIHGLQFFGIIIQIDTVIDFGIDKVHLHIARDFRRKTGIVIGADKTVVHRHVDRVAEENVF